MCCVVPCLGWWPWLEAKKGRMEDNVREFYEAQLDGGDQTANFEKHLSDQTRSAYESFVEQTWELQEYSITSVLLQGLGVGGEATIETKRNGKSYSENFHIKDDRSKFTFTSASDTSGNYFN